MPVELSETRLQETFVAAMQRVYLWMAAGLFLTAAVSWFVISSPAVLELVFGNRLVFFGLIIGELLLVIAVTAAAARLSAGKALALFFLYAAINGVTMAFVFLVYTASSIALAFGATAVLFAFMAFIGLTTKQDLTRWGPILFIGLIGLIIGSVVNVFLANSTLDWIITYAGIGLFLALTVYDSQRIKDMTRESLAAGQADVPARIGVVGALRLYLDFINLFLMLLRLFRRR
jgi:hypothetical protein